MSNKLFNLRCGFYGIEYEAIFTHENKSKIQFNKDVNMLISKYADEYLETLSGEFDFAYLRGLIKYAASKMDELGYVRMDLVEYNITGALRYGGHEDKQLKKILGSKLYKKIINYNKELSDKYEKGLIDEI